MIALPSGTRAWLAAGPTDMRRGFDGLSRQVQQVLGHDPFTGHLFVFRGKRGGLVKVLYWDTQGLCCLPSGWGGGVSYGLPSKTAPAQLSMLLEGIDWRMPPRT